MIQSSFEGLERLDRRLKSRMAWKESELNLGEMNLLGVPSLLFRNLSGVNLSHSRWLWFLDPEKKPKSSSGGPLGSLGFSGGCSIYRWC